MRILLDTDAYSAFKRGDEHVLRLIQDSSEIVFSVVVLGGCSLDSVWGTARARTVPNCRHFWTTPTCGWCPCQP